MQEKILEYLKKKQDYISGDQISQRLGISRQALWKHIQELKDSGYDIVAVPHLGYRLDSLPDRLFPHELSYGLNTKFIAKKIYYFTEVTSTMDAALDLGIKGCPEGTLVVAEMQSKGRGRLGREWLSPRYKGIYFSLVLRPEILPNQASIFTLLSAVSITEALKDACGLDAQIKWPNDILVEQKKLGGILTELNAEMDKVRFITIGAGLNVNNDKKALLSTATSVKEQKKEETNRVGLLQEILRKTEANYLLFQKKQSAPILEKWRNYNITLGKRVKVSCRQRHIEGLALDIDLDGSLMLRNDAGLVQKITSGDVTHSTH